MLKAAIAALNATSINAFLFTSTLKPESSLPNMLAGVTVKSSADIIIIQSSISKIMGKLLSAKECLSNPRCYLSYRSLDQHPLSPLKLLKKVMVGMNKTTLLPT